MKSAELSLAGLGMGLAAGLSWLLHRSILLAILHALLGWFYVGLYLGAPVARWAAR